MKEQFPLKFMFILLLVHSNQSCKTHKPVINATRIDGVYKKDDIGWSESVRLYPSMDYTYTITSHGLGGYDHLGKWSIDRDTLLLGNFPKINRNHFTFQESFDSTLDNSTFKVKCFDESGEFFEPIITINDTINRFVASTNKGDFLFVGIKVRKLRCEYLGADSEIEVKEGINRINATIHLLPVLQTSMYSKWKIIKGAIIPYDKNDSLIQIRKLSK